MKIFLSLLFIVAFCIHACTGIAMEEPRLGDKRARVAVGEKAHESSDSSASSSDWELPSYVFKERGDDFRKRARAACANPRTICVDFSLVHLKDRDLDVIFKGLVDREKKKEKTGDGHSLQLLNIESSEISEEGLLRFLVNLQSGRTRGDETIYPDVRGTILKIGFALTEEFLESIQKSAPKVLAGRLRIVD